MSLPAGHRHQLPPRARVTARLRPALATGGVYLTGVAPVVLPDSCSREVDTEDARSPGRRLSRPFHSRWSRGSGHPAARWVVRGRQGEGPRSDAALRDQQPSKRTGARTSRRTQGCSQLPRPARRPAAGRRCRFHPRSGGSSPSGRSCLHRTSPRSCFRRRAPTHPTAVRQRRFRSCTSSLQA